MAHAIQTYIAHQLIYSFVQIHLLKKLHSELNRTSNVPQTYFEIANDTVTSSMSEAINQPSTNQATKQSTDQPSNCTHSFAQLRLFRSVCAELFTRFVCSDSFAQILLLIFILCSIARALCSELLDQFGELLQDLRPNTCRSLEAECV